MSFWIQLFFFCPFYHTPWHSYCSKNPILVKLMSQHVGWRCFALSIVLLGWLILNSPWQYWPSGSEIKCLLDCKDRTMSSTHSAVNLVGGPRPWWSKSYTKLGQVEKEGTRVQLCFMPSGIRNFLINSPFLPIDSRSFFCDKSSREPLTAWNQYPAFPAWARDVSWK